MITKTKNKKSVYEWPTACKFQQGQASCFSTSLPQKLPSSPIFHLQIDTERIIFQNIVPEHFSQASESFLFTCSQFWRTSHLDKFCCRLGTHFNLRNRHLHRHQDRSSGKWINFRNNASIMSRLRRRVKIVYMNVRLPVQDRKTNNYVHQIFFFLFFPFFCFFFLTSNLHSKSQIKIKRGPSFDAFDGADFEFPDCHLFAFCRKTATKAYKARKLTQLPKLFSVLYGWTLPCEHVPLSLLREAHVVLYQRFLVYRLSSALTRRELPLLKGPRNFMITYKTDRKFNEICKLHQTLNM